MKVKLAGYNIDAEIISGIRDHDDSTTPEVLSASYARISRDPREITKLREEAREQVEKARKSNETIVFGLGHSSVAEHAVFNFDIMDISRLAVEALESFRLAAYTEKSQRYIKIGRDFILPREIRENGFEESFRELISFMADQYSAVFNKIIEDGGGRSSAKEDARYLLPLATGAQLGMTVNARELEYMVSRLASHPLRELNDLAEELTARSSEIAPSLIKYPDPVKYHSNFFTTMERLSCLTEPEIEMDEQVRLISAPGNADELIASALLFRAGGAGMNGATGAAKGLSRERMGEIIESTMEDIKPYDSVLREFEFAGFIFEVTVSASCFAQLKRHRMATISPQRYLPEADVRVPDSAAGCREIFEKVAERSRELYSRIADVAGGHVAEYALLNAHRRRVLIGMNLRELYHFSRLRSDTHAQWEIRELSDKICAVVKDKAPMASILLGGKDSFGRSGDRGTD